MTSKKIVKLAVIRRDDDVDSCPFGLSPIPHVCKIANNFVDKMLPLDRLGPYATDEEKQKIVAANTRLLTWRVMANTEQQLECKYANKLFPGKDVVECDYGDTAQGESSQNASGGATLVGSPSYSKHFSEPNFDGLLSHPIPFYGDNNISRNLYYGILSLQEVTPKDVLLKLAEEALDNASKEKEKA